MQIQPFLKTISGLSPNTLRAYEGTLWLLDSFIKTDEPDPNDIRKFLNTYKPSTLHRHKAAIKAYWEWRYFQKKEPWPFDRRSFIAPREQVLRYIKPEVVHEMAELAENEDDRMYILTLFMLGCRIHELLLIQNDSITDAGVLVKTKGGKTRLKILTKDFRDVFIRYAKKKKGKIFPMSYNYYYCLLKKLGKTVHHPEVSPHMLRHARAIDLLRKGMKLSDVQQFLGHASINTTAIYLQITGGDLAEELDKVESNHQGKKSAMEEIRDLVKSDPSVKKQLRKMLLEEGED